MNIKALGLSRLDLAFKFVNLRYYVFWTVKTKASQFTLFAYKGKKAYFALKYKLKVSQNDIQR